MSQRFSSKGAAMPLVALLCAAMMISVLLLAGVADRVLDRASCQHAADAAALAGVVEGRGGANRLAAANGGVVVAFVEANNVAKVRVRCESTVAEANAERRLRSPSSD